MCFILIPLFLLYSIRSLRTLAPFSTTANLMLFVGNENYARFFFIKKYILFLFQKVLALCSIIFSQLCRRFPHANLFRRFRDYQYFLALCSSPLKLLASWVVLVYFSEFYLILFLFLSQILAIEEKMAKPKSYIKPFGVLNVGMAIVLSLYTLLGFFGYWEYGDEALGSVTLNIPQEAV